MRSGPCLFLDVVKVVVSDMLRGRLGSSKARLITMIYSFFFLNLMIFRSVS